MLIFKQLVYWYTTFRIPLDVQGTGKNKTFEIPCLNSSQCSGRFFNIGNYFRIILFLLEKPHSWRTKSSRTYNSSSRIQDLVITTIQRVKLVRYLVSGGGSQPTYSINTSEYFCNFCVSKIEESSSVHEDRWLCIQYFRKYFVLLTSDHAPDDARSFRFL